jgi:hypothetical protein
MDATPITTTTTTSTTSSRAAPVYSTEDSILDQFFPRSKRLHTDGQLTDALTGVRSSYTEDRPLVKTLQVYLKDGLKEYQTLLDKHLKFEVSLLKLELLKANSKPLKMLGYQPIFQTVPQLKDEAHHMMQTVFTEYCSRTVDVLAHVKQRERDLLPKVTLNASMDASQIATDKCTLYLQWLTDPDSAANLPFLIARATRFILEDVQELVINYQRTLHSTKEQLRKGAQQNPQHNREVPPKNSASDPPRESTTAPATVKATAGHPSAKRPPPPPERGRGRTPRSKPQHSVSQQRPSVTPPINTYSEQQPQRRHQYNTGPFPPPPTHRSDPPLFQPLLPLPQPQPYPHGYFHPGYYTTR